MAGYSSGYSGGIDYSAFSQPPDMVASYGMAGMGKDMAYGYYGMEQETFQMPPAFPPAYEPQRKFHATRVCLMLCSFAVLPAVRRSQQWIRKRVQADD